MRRKSGFSLMEVMVAMAILAGALLGLMLGLQRSVTASHHARLMTQATFLCRQQLVELEEKFLVDGFTDDALVKEESGEFEDPAFKKFRWATTIEKIRLPSVDQIQSAATKLLSDRQQIGAQGAGGGGGGDKGGGLGNPMMGTMLGPIKDTLEQGIRRVTVKVLWDEPGRPNRSVEVVAFYTDLRKVPL